MLRRLRYGEDVVVVSGLPRSGTSMMMRMLEAGGLGMISDGQRTADEDNPRGYFELEQVKHLAEETDRAWTREARGRAVKVISHLLEHLPAQNFYRVLFMQRDLGEVIASQNKMLERRGEENPVDDARTRELYERHLRQMRGLLASRPNFEVLEVSYKDTLEDPAGSAARAAAFLGCTLDAEKMAEAVDRALYRNRGSA
jgi:hypothetical protein